MAKAISAGYGRARFNRSAFSSDRAEAVRDASGRVEIRLWVSSPAPETYVAFTLPDEFPPGGVLEIDTDKYTVKLNGTPLLDGYSGPFFDLCRGAEVIYTDRGTERSIRLTVQATEQHY